MLKLIVVVFFFISYGIIFSLCKVASEGNQQLEDDLFLEEYVCNQQSQCLVLNPGVTIKPVRSILKEIV